ncbi:hypothetical protein D3C77_759260 [compost metagenome]
MRILHDFLPVLAGNEGGNQVHGTGTVKSVQRNQVFQARGLGLLEHLLHAA